ncbi:MAG: hypothetical protein AABX86_00080 [Nanoarchaeota archaeon]
MATLIEQSKKIFDKYRPIFEQLEDYDKTHKLRKLRYKKRIDLTIDSQTWNAFKAHCKQHHLKMSNVVEEVIKKRLKR